MIVMLDVTRLVRMDKGAKEVVIGMLRLYIETDKFFTFFRRVFGSLLKVFH